MITNSQIRVIESSLEKLKPTVYGMKADYRCSIIEKNVIYNSHPSDSRFTNNYRPILEVNVKLTGFPNIFFVNSGIIETEMQGFFEKVFSYILPSDHLLVKRPWAVVYKFEHNGKQIGYNDVIKSFAYEQFKTKFRKDNKPGTLVVSSQTIGYSINYSDLAFSEYGDQNDLNVFIECETESFNYINSNGQNILITDDIWNDFMKETEEDIDMVKNSLIGYLNTISSDYGSTLSDEFSYEVNLREKLPQYVIDNYGWKYEAMCNSVTNLNDFPYDYSEGDTSRKNLFLNYCHLNLEKD
jgi:hypothetical protein